MADVTYSSSITTPDGYEREYSVYYATENGAAPLVCLMGGSGTAKGDTTLTDKMETLRDDGFTCLLMESRGHGAGVTWMDANGYTEDDYGWTYFSTLEIADIARIISDVRGNATHGAYVDPTKLGWLGRSQGAVLGYMMAACADEQIQGVRIPKVNVLCVEAFTPDYLDALLPKNLSNYQKSGRRPNSYAWGLYEDPSYYIYTPYTDAVKTDLIAEDIEGLEDTLKYGTSDTPRWEVATRFGQHIDKDTAVHFGMSYDDRWGPTNAVLRFMEDHPKSYLWVGGADHHGATDVKGQNNQIQLQRRGILAHYLLGGTTLTNFGFDNDDIDSMSRITMAIVPNNEADYQREDRTPQTTAGAQDPWVDVVHSYLPLTCEQPGWLFEYGSEDATFNDTAVGPTTLWLGAGTLATSAPGAQSEDSVSNTWSSAKTTTDLKNAVEGGTSSTDIGAWIDDYLTYDTENYTATWNPSGNTIYAGVGQLWVYAKATGTNPQLYAKLEFSLDGGVTWVHLADGWHIWPEDYEEDTYQLINIEMALRAMRLTPNANSRIRVQLANWSPFEPGWVDTKKPIRITPSMGSFTVTVARGGSTPSRVVLPIHSLGTYPNLRPSLHE